LTGRTRFFIVCPVVIGTTTNRTKGKQMKISKLKTAILAATSAIISTSAIAYQYQPLPRYGAGSTMPNPPRYGVPAAPMKDPTQTWQYKAVDKAAPVVRGIRDCSFGALAGSWRGYMGMATGCAGAVSPSLSPYRPLNAY
jgi:hypothetical protein